MATQRKHKNELQEPKNHAIILPSKAVRNGKPPCGFCISAGEYRICPGRYGGLTVIHAFIVGAHLGAAMVGAVVGFLGAAVLVVLAAGAVSKLTKKK